MDIRPIHTEADYEAAMAELQRLWGARVGSPEGDRLDVLATLIDAYETSTFVLPATSEAEVLRAFMEHKGHSQADLAAVLGSASRASEILAGKRTLTLSQIRKLRRAWGIPTDLLIEAEEQAAA